MSVAKDDRPVSEPHHDPATPTAPPSDDSGPRPGDRGQDRPPGGGERRRKRGGSGERRSDTGFADGIERALCVACHHVLPETFPVQGRSGAAVIRPFVVARRPDAVLLCDGEHPGAHMWPDGTPEPLAQTHPLTKGG
jgi:hypothetical protein